jgi:hypothetical protein
MRFSELQILKCSKRHYKCRLAGVNYFCSLKTSCDLTRVTDARQLEKLINEKTVEVGKIIKQ